LGWLWGALNPGGFGAWLVVEQASGFWGQGGAPGAERGRTTLTPGWRLLGRRVVGWGALGGLVMRRAVWVGLAARLMVAGRDRRRALRSWLPHTDRGGAGWCHS